MEHWDPQDADGAVRVRLPRRDRQRLAQLLQPAQRPKRDQRAASLFGMVIAVAFLAGVAWALSPVSPVSSALSR